MLDWHNQLATRVPQVSTQRSSRAAQRTTTPLRRTLKPSDALGTTLRGMTDVSEPVALLDLDLDALVADGLLGGDLDDLLLPGDAQGPTRPASQHSTHAPVASDDALQPPPPSKRGPWRDRRKEEIEYLRQRARELEAQLRSLEASSADPRSATEQSAARSLFDSSWKSIARRQQGKRQRAEAENRQLKRAVSEYVMAARRLQDVVYRSRLGPSSADVAYSLSEALAWTPGDVASVNRLVREVDEAYTRVDFELLKLMLRTREHDDASREGFDFTPTMVDHGESALYFDLPSANLIPFPFHRVCDAVWAAVTTLFPRGRGLALESEAFHAAAKLPMHCSSGLSGGPASDIVGSSIIVIRRFIESGRMVLVWRCVDASTGPRKCVSSDTTGWCVLEPVPVTSDAAHATGTLVRGSACVSPVVGVSEGVRMLEEVRQVSRRLTAGLSCDFKALKEMVEDSLLGELMQNEKKTGKM